MAIQNSLNLGDQGVITANGDGTFTLNTLTQGAILLGGPSNTILDTGVLAKGSILGGNGSGSPTKVSVGSDNETIVANSSVTAGFEWGTASSGSGIWTPVSSSTASNDSSVEFSLGSEDIYRVVFYGVNPTTDPIAFSSQISDDSGVTYEASNYRYARSDWRGNNSTATTDHSNSSTLISLAIGNSTTTSDGTLSGEIYIYNPSNTTEPTMFLYRTICEDANATARFSTGGAYWDQNAAVTNIRFYFGSGNIGTGEFALESRSVTT